MHNFYSCTVVNIQPLLYPGVPNTESELWQSSSAWLTLVVLVIAHGSQQGALFTLSQLLSIPYRWITRVFYRQLKVSRML